MTGGAKSGKSRYAQELAESLSGSKCFIATCPPIDSEMEEKIVNHQAERKGKGWDTVEEQIDIAGVIKNTNYSVYIIDCLTLWINNIVFCAQKSQEDCDEKEIMIRCEQLITSIKRSKGYLIVVTNEVGMSIVPESRAARHFRDLVGRCNQIMAEAADEVILVSCGIPLQLK